MYWLTVVWLLSIATIFGVAVFPHAYITLHYPCPYYIIIINVHDGVIVHTSGVQYHFNFPLIILTFSSHQQLWHSRDYSTSYNFRAICRSTNTQLTEYAQSNIKVGLYFIYQPTLILVKFSSILWSSQCPPSSFSYAHSHTTATPVTRSVQLTGNCLFLIRAHHNTGRGLCQSLITIKRQTYVSSTRHTYTTTNIELYVSSQTELM